MYKGFASELFVPYMEIDENWYFSSYMDAGEFGLGATAMSLVPLNDCPRYSYFMDGLFVTADGKPFVQPNIICVFERYAGDISWRHSDLPIHGFEVRNCKFSNEYVIKSYKREKNMFTFFFSFYFLLGANKRSKTKGDSSGSNGCIGWKL